MKRILFTQILLLIFSINSLTIAQAEKDFRIKYISAGHVYIDAGAQQQLSVGDRLNVYKNSKTIATLKILYIAHYSASCAVEKKSSDLSPGMMVRLVQKTVQPESAVDQDTIHEKTLIERPAPISRSKNSGHITRLSGTIALQYLAYLNRTQRQFGYHQPGFRISLKLRDMFFPKMNLTLRSRSRYTDRMETGFSSIPTSEWRHRIYEVTLAFEDKYKPLNFKLGRIISSKISAVGYIDGLAIQHNISSRLNWGIFAGAQPEWNYSRLQTSLRKYGVYIDITNGQNSNVKIEHTSALMAEYHGRTVSRELIYMRNLISTVSGWSLYQVLELDVNRNWRKDKTGQIFTLSALYLNARYQVTRWLSTGISYDNRHNYYYYENRTLADSLFDNALRQGFRAHTNLKLGKYLRLRLQGGMRHRSGDSSSTYSWGSTLHAYNFWQRLTFMARFQGYSSHLSSGQYPSVTLSRSFSRGHLISVGYGLYNYKLNTFAVKSRNHWLRVQGQIQLPFNLYLDMYYGYNWGDGQNGTNVNVDIGYTF